MSALCLSLATNLRCESLSQFESIILLIPPVLELLFSLGLVISRWKSGLRHLFLAAEGFSFLVLAVLDFLAHLLPQAQTDLEVFKVLDIVIGTGSLVPLLLYTAFLSSFTISEMIPNLPPRIQTFTKYTLLLLIPTLLLLHGIASLAGISYRAFAATTAPNAPVILAVGFADANAQSEWTFFSIIALSFFVVLQALNFFITFYQLVRAFVGQRAIVLGNRQNDEAHFVRGTGWMALGIKLGVIEGIVGYATFARGGFAVALTRRIVRLLARGSLVVGVVKGIDIVEDFDILPNGKRRPPSRIQISNPRISTFRRLSRGAWDAAFGPPTSDSARDQIMRADRQAYQRFGGTDVEKGGVPFPSQSRRSSLVTVRQDPGAAPVMDMRFSPLRMSSLALPTPESIDRATQARPNRVSRYSFGGTPIDGTPPGQSGLSELSLSTVNYAPPSPPPQVPARAVLPNAPPPRAFLPFGGGSGSKHVPTTSVSTSAYSQSTVTGAGERYNRADNPYINPTGRPAGPRDSVMSASSVASDSLEVVRAISSQFPGLPPRVTGKYRGSVLGQLPPTEDAWIARTVRPKNNNETLASVPEESRAGSSEGGLQEDDFASKALSVGSGKRKPAPIPSPMSSGFAGERYDEGLSPNPDASLKRTTTDSGARTMQTYDTRGSRLGMPWLENDTNAEIMVEGRAELEEVWWKSEAGLTLKRGPEGTPLTPDTPMLGQVRSRTTPTATTSSFARASEYVEHDDMPDLPQFSSVVQSSELARAGSPVRDSQVLGAM